MSKPLINSSNTKTILAVCGAFVVGWSALVGHRPTTEEVITAEGRAKIAAYNSEESNYWAVQARCGPDGSGFACDHTLNDLARLEVKHARWTIARNRKFGDYDLEAQWIVAHAGDLPGYLAAWCSSDTRWLHRFLEAGRGELGDLI